MGNDPVLYVIAVIGLAILGALAKILWSGLQTQIVKAVLDSSLNTVLGGFKQSMTELKDDIGGIRTDINYIRTAADEVARRQNMGDQELGVLRSRFDTSLAETQKRLIDYLDFRRAVEAFMHNHTHGGPSLPDPPSP